MQICISGKYIYFFFLENKTKILCMFCSLEKAVVRNQSPLWFTLPQQTPKGLQYCSNKTQQLWVLVRAV